MLHSVWTLSLCVLAIGKAQKTSTMSSFCCSFDLICVILQEKIEYGKSF